MCHQLPSLRVPAAFPSAVFAPSAAMRVIGIVNRPLFEAGAASAQFCAARALQYGWAHAAHLYSHCGNELARIAGADDASDSAGLRVRRCRHGAAASTTTPTCQVEAVRLIHVSPMSPHRDCIFSGLA